MCHKPKGGNYVLSHTVCMLCFIKCSCIMINGRFKLLSNKYKNMLLAVVNFLTSLNPWIM